MTASALGRGDAAIAAITVVDDVAESVCGRMSRLPRG